MEQILSVRNLQTHFTTYSDHTIAVNNISFSLNTGETVGIVGESGSGKSVTALSILQLLASPGKITGGEILFKAKDHAPIDLLSLPEKDMRKYRGKEIAMIFQEPMTSLNPLLTCGKQVAETILLHLKKDKQEAKEMTFGLFKKVKFDDPGRIFNSYPHQLSGGQKQRVMIAMAMSCNPSILIADEPTTALDVTVQARILELMDQLRTENNMSMLFITHDLGVVAEIANRVVVMYKGKIVEEGNVEKIFSEPRHPYTKGLIACRPPLQKRLRRLPVINDFMEETESGQVREIPLSVNDSFNKNEISYEETEHRLQHLQLKQPILSVINIRTHFPVRRNLFGKATKEIKAVDDVSFNVFPGETLGLVGESGSGKTTLGLSILQLIKPTTGTVMFEGSNLVQLNNTAMRNIRRHLQVIFQDPYSSLNPRLTAGYAIMEPMIVHRLYNSGKECRERALDLMDKVNLHSDFFNRFPHEFSGGQRQRICIARALALNPKFIVCDESVSALDVSIQAQVLNLLIHLREEFNFTYIFISHDLSVVKFMSDRILVMKGGKIIEEGKADEVYFHPASEYTRTLINAIPKGDLAGIREKAAFRNKSMDN
ncbi:MAG: ABC transporter ATP-binding protein [Chitinophagales bacterium]|nr:ABC transporter ATP-binding protein [Chitinophagales bacterium]